MPMGSSGFRWGQEKGKWNLLLRDGIDGTDIQPALTFLGGESVQVAFDDFGAAQSIERGVPVKRLALANGETATVTTVYDLLMAQFGVPRGLPGSYPTSYDDEDHPYTPAWSERYTGMGRETLIRFAREWGNTARLTKGQVHGDYRRRHQSLVSQQPHVSGTHLRAHVLRLRRRQRRRLGALRRAREAGAGRIVGLHRIRPRLVPPPRACRTPRAGTTSTLTSGVTSGTLRTNHTVPQHQRPDSVAKGHTADLQVKAVRNGWLPFYPQFNQNSIRTGGPGAGERSEDGRGDRRLDGGRAEAAAACASRWRIRTPRRTGPACGLSGAAMH